MAELYGFWFWEVTLGSAPAGDAREIMIIKEQNYENDSSVLFVLSQTGDQEMVRDSNPTPPISWDFKYKEKYLSLVTSQSESTMINRQKQRTNQSQAVVSLAISSFSL